MQISFSMFILLASICFIGTIASPIGSNKRDQRMLVLRPPPGIIVGPVWPPYELCGYMGVGCATNSDCCTNNVCGYPVGYSDDSLRCCGMEGATGCNATSPYPGTGCCYRQYCLAATKPGEANICMPILY